MRCTYHTRDEKEEYKMKAFMDKDFLLSTETAKKLYNNYADMKKIPVLDYHCHTLAWDAVHSLL